LGSEAANQNLGGQVATFRGRSIELSLWLFLFLPGLLLIIACYLYGIYLAAITYQQYGPALAVARSQTWLLLATIILILLATYLIFRILIALQRIQVFEGGLILRNFYLRQRLYQWKDLSGISSSATMHTILGKSLRTIPTGKIYPFDRRPIIISRDLEGVPRLVKIIKSKTYPLVWPQVKSTFRSGRAVNFGRIKMTREFLEIGNRSIPWDTISRLHTEAGYLVVELHDDSSRKVPTIDIPNLELLLKAVDWGFL